MERLERGWLRKQPSREGVLKQEGSWSDSRTLAFMPSGTTGRGVSESFLLLDSGKRRSMFMKVGKKWFGWLAALALWPVVGWGQVIVVPPRNTTVCVGESTAFVSKAHGGVPGWYINEAVSVNFENQTKIREDRYTKDGITISTLSIDYSENFNGLIIRSFVLPFDELSLQANSTAAYLFYKINQQFPVTGLTPSIDNSTAQFSWDAHNTNLNLTTQYLFGVYDRNNHLIANQTTDATQISYDLPPRANDTCQYLEFKVTADQCPDPDSVFIQTGGTSFTYTNPDISPVTAEFDNNKTVLISWTPDGGSLFWVVVTNLANDNETEIKLRGIPPYGYIPPRCGQYNLKVAVSPAECAEPGFTQSTSISFTIPCPTTEATEETTETEITGQPSGTQASYPSLLLAVAAIVPLLGWQH